MKRHILVTGAASGIGKAILTTLLHDQHHVYAAVRNQSQCSATSANLQVIEIDLQNIDRIPEKVKHSLDLYPQIDGVICSAGRGLFANLEEFSYSQMQDYMTLNLLSPMFLIRALLPHFKRQGLADVIYIGSDAALYGAKKATLYSCAKFGMRGFIQSLRAECASSRVRVSMIHPGMVDTPFYDRLHFKPGSAELSHLRADDIAQAVRLIVNAHAGTVFDEICLTPLKKTIEFKP